MDRTIALDILSSVSVASPCSVPWESMKGDNRARFCGECKLNVYNLSGMAAIDAANLVQRREGRMCVNFFRRSDGTILTADCPKGLRPRIRWMAGRIAAAVAAVFGIILVPAGCSSFRTGGDICPPESWKSSDSIATSTRTPSSGPADGQLERIR